MYNLISYRTAIFTNIFKPESPHPQNNQHDRQEQSHEQAGQDSKYLPASRSFAFHPPRDDGQRSEREDAYSIHHYRRYQGRIFEMATGELGTVFVTAKIISTKKGDV